MLGVGTGLDSNFSVEANSQAQRSRRICTRFLRVRRATRNSKESTGRREQVPHEQPPFKVPSTSLFCFTYLDLLLFGRDVIEEIRRRCHICHLRIVLVVRHGANSIAIAQKVTHAANDASKSRLKTKSAPWRLAYARCRPFSKLKAPNTELRSFNTRQFLPNNRPIRDNLGSATRIASSHDPTELDSQSDWSKKRTLTTACGNLNSLILPLLLSPSSFSFLWFVRLPSLLEPPLSPLRGPGLYVAGAQNKALRCPLATFHRPGYD